MGDLAQTRDLGLYLIVGGIDPQKVCVSDCNAFSEDQHGTRRRWILETPPGLEAFELSNHEWHHASSGCIGH